MLVVCLPPHPVCDPLAVKLGDLGCAVTRTEDVYHAVVTLARDHARFAVAIVAVDFLNRDELRLFPMAKRRWPALRLVAVSRPAFAYKASIAELAGADLVITDIEAVAPLVETLGLSTSRARELPPRETEAPSPPREAARPAPAPAVSMPPRDAPQSLTLPTAGRSPTTVAAPPGASSPPVASPRPPAEAPAPHETDEEDDGMEIAPPRRKPPRPPQVVLPDTSQEILTEEEISALMADMDDDEEEEPQRKNGTEND
ncbi:MAG: hypothetical protein JXL80_03575 [Planctomycetes bacterium]|nr:hypothetical protein [Planctomycetota bacterium]